MSQKGARWQIPEPWQKWAWAPASVGAAVMTGVAQKPFVEPLTGIGLTGCFIVILLNALLFGSAFVLIFRKWWWILSVFLILFGLVLGIPAAPSKAGRKLQLGNQTTSPVNLTIFPSEFPRRKVMLVVPPKGSTNYDTAPGDYSEALELTFRSSNRDLKASLGQLRSNTIVCTATGLQLRPADRR